ncbi:ssoi [Drechmeria coniospora]|uniref:Ssoi n=1 Tax=Drechmeria coniospora TaxID=98403 RepID=A0A151GMK5_DRECN|nr:ssoi [Drechmeria coniospora]KYK58330.1 ssoi [Drechmeria coniospora]ODA83702.1 hypothetical protein RJ55_02217 [Drechmeria coniospora]
MSHGQQDQNPYQHGPTQEAAYGQGYGQAYAHGQNQQYEMQDYGNPYQQQQPQQRPTLSQQDFLARVGELRNDIKSLTNQIEHIGQLHQRALSGTDGRAKQELDGVVADTQMRNEGIKNGIKSLDRDLANTSTSDGSRNTKKTQLQSLRTFFKSELDKYQSIERDYQHKYREQIARQYRIVNPEATEEEVHQATEADWGNEGVFQTALRSNRTGHASSLLGNVRARHGELKGIEDTLYQLSQLYEQLAVLVDRDEPVVQAAESNAQTTVENIEKGNEQVKLANEHARRARRLKWWCAIITCVILLAIALGIGLGICLTGDRCSRKN